MKSKEQRPDSIGAVMVVGGGIAGIQASLDLADLGYYVYLVEKSASIGGVMAQLDKTFPDQRLRHLNPGAQAGGGRSVSQHQDPHERQALVR